MNSLRNAQGRCLSPVGYHKWWIRLPGRSTAELADSQSITRPACTEECQKHAWSSSERESLLDRYVEATEEICGSSGDSKTYLNL